jgi:hypothetical protein
MGLPKLLLIRGLGHSGTTILDLALGSHPRMVGLGEAVRILREPMPGEEQRGPALLRADLRHRRVCTCGLTAAECPVWGEMLAWLPGHDHLPLAVKFQGLMERVERHASGLNEPIQWIVDSYQDDFDLPFQSIPGLDIRVLFLVRDIRSWVYSRSFNLRGGFNGQRALLACFRWYRLNRKFDRALARCGKPVFHLGYEEFALAPEKVLQGLCSWLELDYDAAMLSPGRLSSSHILSGNRVRFDVDKSSKIRYDASWLHGPAWPASLALICPGVGRLNQRLVYASQWLER